MTVQRAPECDSGPEMPRNCWSELGYEWDISGVRACFDSLSNVDRDGRLPHIFPGQAPVADV